MNSIINRDEIAYRISRLPRNLSYDEPEKVIESEILRAIEELAAILEDPTAFTHGCMSSARGRLHNAQLCMKQIEPEAYDDRD